MNRKSYIGSSNPNWKGGSTTRKDPRHGLPSASSFSILAKCPGSFALCKSIPEKAVDNPDEQALRGTKIHLAWETGSTVNLSEDEMEDYSKTITLAESSKQEWIRSLDNPEGIVELKETRLWYKDADGNPLASGQFDRAFIANGSALIQDLKSGWCTNLAPSTQSWQLRLLAVMTWLEFSETHKIHRVRCSFVKPKFNSKDSVDYGIDELMHSNMMIRHALWASAQEDANRSPGLHCNYCRAKAYCAEAQAYSLLPSVMASQAVDKVADMPIEDVVKLFQSDLIVRKILEAAKKRLKALPKDDLKALGLMIDDGKKQDPIVNTLGAYKFLEHKIPQEVIWNSLSFSKGELAKALQENCMMTKKEAEGWIARELEIFIEKKRTEGSLVEI